MNDRKFMPGLAGVLLDGFEPQEGPETPRTAATAPVPTLDSLFEAFSKVRDVPNLEVRGDEAAIARFVQSVQFEEQEEPTPLGVPRVAAFGSIPVVVDATIPPGRVAMISYRQEGGIRRIVDFKLLILDGSDGE